MFRVGTTATSVVAHPITAGSVTVCISAFTISPNWCTYDSYRPQVIRFRRWHARSMHCETWGSDPNEIAKAWGNIATNRCSIVDVDRPMIGRYRSTNQPTYYYMFSLLLCGLISSQCKRNRKLRQHRSMPGHPTIFCRPGACRAKYAKLRLIGNAHFYYLCGQTTHPKAWYGQSVSTRFKDLRPIALSSYIN